MHSALWLILGSILAFVVGFVAALFFCSMFVSDVDEQGGGAMFLSFLGGVAAVCLFLLNNIQ